MTRHAIRLPLLVLSALLLALAAPALVTPGALLEGDFRARLQDLMIQDEQGRWWMIGYESRQWYVHDGEKWVRGEPMVSPEETAVSSRTPDIVPARLRQTSVKTDHFSEEISE